MAEVPATRLFSRSSAFVAAWLAELKPKPAAPKHADPAPAAAAAPAKPQQGQRREKPAAAAAEGTSMSKVQLLCGTVLEVTEHPEADGLWCEKIDLGEAQPRTILSGLRGHITKEEFIGRRVCVVANLEPRKMRGVTSEGMVLCASDAEKKTVKLLDVPEGVPNGERITFPGHEGPAEPVLKKKLAKHYDDVAPLLKTNADGVACFGDLPFVSSKGPIACATMPNGIVS